MTTRKPISRTILGSLLAGSIIAVGATGLVMADQERHCNKGAHMERMGYSKDHKGGDRFGRMFKNLDLSTEQQAQIKQIMQENRTQMQSQREASRNDHKALRELATSTAYDPQRVRILADEQAKRQADMIVAHTETFHRVYQILTPEQQAEFAKLREQRQERSEKRNNDQAE